MRITSYNVELTESGTNTLVKENSKNYPYAESMNNPDVIVQVMNYLFHMNRKAEEYLYMIALNTKCKPIGIFEISHGTIDQSLCNPREIFIRALLCGASQIVVLHNHPSGNCEPSKSDIDAYKRLKESGNMLGVPLVDNIIVGNGYYSFMENNI